MKLVFCGTPEFGVPTLEAVIAAGHEVALVVTQPDRAAGRGMEMQAPAVKRVAMERALPVVQPEKIKNNEEFRTRLEEIRPDAILVVAYGRIIPKWMLDLPRFGNINLHGSLLPKYRGAAPIQWAVANGEVVTGVTTMRLDEGLDTGDMLLAQVCPIGQEETAIDVYECLAPVGAKLMVKTLHHLESGMIFPEAQDHSRASLAPILKREDGWIDFSRTAQQIYDRWRGFQPWPGAHTLLRGKKLIVQRMHVAGAGGGEPGVVEVWGDSLVVGCGGGSLIALDEVQLEGKRRMSAAEFLRGYHVRSGERLGL
ncbi:MAG TPA: methionyl-tRNA formyltransferase [Edaphobacter sp.]|jgi:methionyl-tRNA formyltransferase|nr:methionyl-tRNA formyltransferase [Edaphobacter sp.]